MKINIAGVPKALGYFLLGNFMNLILYYTFSPQKSDLLGIMDKATNTSIDSTTKLVIWFGIMFISVLATLLLPVWVLFEEEEIK